MRPIGARRVTARLAGGSRSVPMPLHHRVCGAVAGLLAAASLGGCANQQIANHVIQYNAASAEVHNKAMLINVLRASQRRPLEFTSLQSITGTSASEAESEFDWPLIQN